VSARCAFPRSIDALPAVVAFTEEAIADAALTVAQQHTVHFALEELLTNMVKYAPQGSAELTVVIDCDQGVVDVLLIDVGVDRFDPTGSPDPGVARPIAERQPGGLGLHLVQRMVDSLRYEYRPESREGRTAFRVGGARAGVGTC
jgi:serine/threonine-protein kinase RsbW